MNYLPFCGYWFYGAALITAAQRASYYCSWGLISTGGGSAATTILPFMMHNHGG